MFMAKGGGSANKTFLYQQTKALLNEDSLLKFAEEKIKTLGTRWVVENVMPSECSPEAPEAPEDS